MKVWVRDAVVVLCVFLVGESGLRLFAQTSVSAASLGQRSVAGSLPRAGDRADWVRWREQALARMQGRGNRQSQANDATAVGGSGLIETIAGAAPFQAPIKALQAGLGVQLGVVQDAEGNLYVSSPEFSAVLKVDTSSNVTVYAGHALGLGPAVQSGDGGPASAATLVDPTGLALDSSGNLYIADRLACTVRVVKAATGVIATVAGTPGECFDAGDGGPALKAMLFAPDSLALDGQGNLYIAETSLIRRVNLTSGAITTFAGVDGTPPSCDFSATQQCPATSVILQMYGTNVIAAGPNGLAAFFGSVNGGSNLGPQAQPLNGVLANIDYSSGMMQLIAGGGPTVLTVQGNTAIGTDFDGQLVNLAFDKAGNLDLTDTEPASVQQLPPNGTALTTIAGDGSYGYSGDGGPATSATLNGPYGIFASPNGSLLFSDYVRIRSINSSGTINTIAGNGTENYFGDGAAAVQAGLSFPDDAAFDGSGNLYIADSDNGAIRKIDAATGIISTLPLPFLGAYSMVSDGQSNLYLASVTGLSVLNLQTGNLKSIPISPLPLGDSPGEFLQTQLAFDGKQTLYLAGAEEVGSVDIPSGTYTLVTPSPVYPNQPVITSPFGIALDGNGNLYLSDTGNNRVWEVNLSSGNLKLIAGDPKYGSLGYSGDGGPAANALLDFPEGLLCDGAGHLLIADSRNNAIRSIDLTSGIITTVAGTGTPGYTGDGSNSAAADLRNPYSLALDPNGNLLIADVGNDRVRRVVLHLTPLTATLAASPTSAVIGGADTLTATYSGLFFGFAPTGAVTFLDGTTAIGTGTLAVGANGGYVATLTDSSLAAGTHNITAQYAGDAHYAANTSAAVVLTVTSPLPPSFTVAAAPASLSLTQGASGTAVFTVTPANGFNQAVSFSCGSGLPTGVSCSFSPASVTPSGTAAVTSTLTITTTGAGTARLQTAPSARRWWTTGGGAMLACGLLLWPVRRRKLMWQTLCVAGALAVVGTLGCSGSGGGSGGGTNPNETPAGSYTLTVNAGAGAASQTVNFALTVTQ